MRRVREAIGILVLADEPWFSPRDGASLAEQDACDIINIKLTKTGRLNRARNVGTVVSAYSPLLYQWHAGNRRRYRCQRSVRRRFIHG